MSVADSPDLSKKLCPGCDPTTDQMKEITQIVWCDLHQPVLDGVDDSKMPSGSISLSLAAEAEGETCRQAARVLHRPHESRTEED